MTTLKRNISSWVRWVHIYLSMFSFASLLFFALTGITLNHTSWFEHQQISEQVEGDLMLPWVHTDASRVDELKVVEHLRNSYSIKVPLSDFITDEMECSVSFKGPGYTADGIIDRSTGHYEMTITKAGLIAIMNDLHKGRDTGTMWALLIDISAVVMILVSLTGFLMIFFLKSKRGSGLVITAVGAITIVLIYYIFV